MYTILPNDSLVVCFSYSGIATGLHTHECLELVIVLQGSVRHFLDSLEI